MFNSAAVLALRLKILLCLKNDPPRTGLLANWSFAAWLGKHLSYEEFGLLTVLVLHLGESACNDWMVKVLVESGVYESDEAGYVQGV